MQFTPQQLQGAGRYGSKTLIGNWFEDQCAEEAKHADFRKSRSNPQSTASRHAKLDKCRQRVPHTYSADGRLRFGDTVILRHVDTLGSVAVDLWEPLTTGGREGLVMVSPEKRPTARNTFTIEAVTEEALRDPYTEPSADGVLKYGEPFFLRVNDSLLVDERCGLLRPPRYLASRLKASGAASRVSNAQAVFVDRGKDSAAVWRCAAPASAKADGVRRFLSRGEAVAANREVVLVHRQTNAKLCADRRVADGTDFGLEWEACCRNAAPSGRRNCLGAERSGRGTADTTAAVELPMNRFILSTAQDPQASVEFRRLPPPPTPEEIVRRVLGIVGERSRGSVRALRSAFRAMDGDGSGTLDRGELAAGLRAYGVDLSGEHLDLLFDHLDMKGRGLVRARDFVAALRGGMGPRRRRLVDMAYRVLDRSGDGVVTKEDIRAAYDVSRHPKVVSGLWTEDEAALDFMAQWEGAGSADGAVTKDEFVEYYEDVSAGVEDDDAFELAMRNAWHMAGGEGAAAGSANARVRVTYADGAEEIVEIVDDLGLDLRDFSAVRARLEAQGVTGVEAVALSGAA